MEHNGRFEGPDAPFCCAGVSEQRGIVAALRGTYRSPAQFADPVWLGALLDAGQPVQEPLGAEPSLPGIPVSLWHSFSLLFCLDLEILMSI